MRKATINLSALKHNFSVVKKMAPESKVIAMIKSNAYGHGLIPVGLALSEADAFGVACTSEAIKLREAGVRQSIILMSGPHEPSVLSIIDEYQLDSVIHAPYQIEYFKNTTFQYSPQIWLKVNTGMNRLGFLPDQLPDAIAQLKQCNSIKKEINWMTHFANADSPTAKSNQEQLELFQKLIKDYLPGERSISNSGGLFSLPEAHLNWVRPGIMLYGISPLENKTAPDLGLKPVMTLSSQLIAINHLKKGAHIGYGSSWECPEDMPVGVISYGYGDGYPRVAGDHQAMVSVNGIQCPLVGRVSMDYLTVDLRNCPDPKVGDSVILWGEGLPVERLASKVGTIGYELVCHVIPRVEFEYV